MPAEDVDNTPWTRAKEMAKDVTEQWNVGQLRIQIASRTGVRL